MVELRPFPLDDTHRLDLGELPPELLPDAGAFDDLWASHPDAFHEIVMHGRKVHTPRWQQAYGTDYHYTGSTNRALPLTPVLSRWLAWSREAIDPRLNSILINWYEGASGHYIGKHRDSDVNRVEGSPIVTLSFGEERTFRMRPWRGQGFLDVPAVHGGIIVIPWDTNLTWTHEVPPRASSRGRRISLTLRAFHT